MSESTIHRLAVSGVIPCYTFLLHGTSRPIRRFDPQAVFEAGKSGSSEHSRRIGEISPLKPTGAPTRARGSAS